MSPNEIAKLRFGDLITSTNTRIVGAMLYRNFLGKEVFICLDDPDGVLEFGETWLPALKLNSYQLYKGKTP